MPKSKRVEISFPAFERSVVPRNELYWITDMQHHHLPHLFSDKENDRRDRWFQTIADTEGHLVLSSHSAEVDFIKRYPNARVVPHVWHFSSTLKPGSGDAQAVRKQYGLPEKFIYIPNQFWVHKDHLTALAALAALKVQGISIPLICTGYQDDYRQPGHFAKVEEFVRQNGLEGQVRFLGVIPRIDQIEIFRLASAVVQPSLFEGWSTVIEDTKAIGRPILASDIAVHREQLADIPDTAFYRAGDSRDLAAKLATSWSRWAAGPDLKREAQAIAATERRTIDAARSFVAIADVTYASLAKRTDKVDA